MSKDQGLNYLLELDGEILAQEKERPTFFESAEQLVTDFFSAVDKFLGEN